MASIVLQGFFIFVKDISTFPLTTLQRNTGLHTQAHPGLLIIKRLVGKFDTYNERIPPICMLEKSYIEAIQIKGMRDALNGWNNKMNKASVFC